VPAHPIAHDVQAELRIDEERILVAFATATHVGLTHGNDTHLRTIASIERTFTDFRVAGRRPLG